MKTGKRKLRFKKPMLAKNYEGHEHRVKFPCYVQPKLDGIRCVTDGQRFWSRNGKLFPIVNLKHLRVPSVPYLMDGELMVSRSTFFEDIVSAVKNGSTLDRSLAKRIRFHVFDGIREEPFRVRTVGVEVLARQWKSRGWMAVKTLRIENRAELKRVAKRFLLYGFEGTMIRSATGAYVSKRTLDLLKWKPMMEKEFKIVGVKQAKGKDKGTPVFKCKVGKKTFNVRPMGSLKQRRRMWLNRDGLIGEMLTVEFQNYTKHGKPRFPRAKVLRNYE